jgi:predicted RNA-binding Zn-ribbon protein involved in translation (DUF1610 family)
MPTETKQHCRQCGFQADPNAEVWASVYHPPLGELTQCPECGSTDTVGV